MTALMISLRVALLSVLPLRTTGNRTISFYVVVATNKNRLRGNGADDEGRSIWWGRQCIDHEEPFNHDEIQHR